MAAAPDRRSCYYFSLGVCVRRFKGGLDLDLVATKALVGSDKGCFGTFALKIFCREGYSSPSCCLSSRCLFLKLVSFARRTPSLSSTPGAFCAPGGAAPLAFFRYTAR